MKTTDEVAQRVVDLSRQLRKLGDTPREAFSADHAAAQSSMASLGYELAGLLLEVAEREENR